MTSKVRLPSFILVGVPKASTTSVILALGSHPQIWAPAREVYFFDDDENFRLGAEFYSTVFDHAPSGAVIGEKTVTYCYDPAVPERMSSIVPDAKLIWIFREPVARAYSSYWHRVFLGQERRSFDEAVKEEHPTLENMRRPHEQRGYLYLDRGLYAPQVSRFLAHFPLEQNLFLLHEDLRTSWAHSMGRILQFIGADRSSFDVIRKWRANVTHAPRSRLIQFYARRLFKGRLPIAEKVTRRLNRIGRVPGYPPLAMDTRDALRRQFVRSNEELAEITGLDLTSWGT